MKKTYSESTGILNELKGQSSHFKPQPTPQQAESVVEEKRVSNQSSERPNRTTEPNGSSSSVIDDIKSGEDLSSRIPTERYSFEIYTHQKERIEDLQYRYKKKTGKKISASRILREAIDDYISKVMTVLDES